MRAASAHAVRGRARLVLALWILAFPGLTLLRARGGTAAEPAGPRPAWAHLVVVTVAEWPAGTGAPEGPAFEDLLRRGVRLGPLFTPSTSSAAAAASLWTGRWPQSHGVLDADRALPLDAWTLASAALASGAHTAAFLEEPLVTLTGIAGFETVLEFPRIAEFLLADRVEGLLREHADERTLLWVHLADAGPGGERLADLLARLQRVHAAIGIAGAGEPAGERALDRRAETLTLVTGLRGAAGDDGEALPDAPFLVPLFVELPTGLNAGTIAYPHLALVDVAGFAAELLRLGPPVPNAQSRPNAFALALAGGRPVRPVELLSASPAPGAAASIFRDGPLRAAFGEDGGLLEAEELLEGFLGRTRRALDPAAAAALAEEAAAFRSALERQATPARAAARTASWRDWR